MIKVWSNVSFIECSKEFFNGTNGVLCPNKVCYTNGTQVLNYLNVDPVI